MKLTTRFVLCALLSVTLFAKADIIVLRDGVSYSGQFTPPANGKLSFTDNQGIHYTLPVSDVQSLVFSNTASHVTLRDGKTYSGQLDGLDVLPFQGSEGIGYRFPLHDVASLVLTGSGRAPSPHSIPSLVIPEGTEIVVRTSDSIESGKNSSGQLYPATIQQEVIDASGGVAIPAGTPAKLVVSSVRGGGAVHSPDARSGPLFGHTPRAAIPGG